ncbi:MAG: trypsin-like peptidase domain-containing protein [Candidatus Kapabacteria bacterium]|nr:trypsin-like peptidase domain-containing protein [Candidatus Kapabacteria bacterium]
MKKSSVLAGGLITSVILIVALIILTNSSAMFGGDVKIGAGSPPVTLNPQIKAMNDGLVAASNAVNPTVVSISVDMEIKQTPNPHGDEMKEFFKFFGQPYGGEAPDDQGGSQHSQASGSGVIISDDGYILTNNHVVEHASDDGIKVTTLDKKVHKAKLIGTDPLTDLAVIKIEGSNYLPAHFGNIEEVKIGELVIAVGNPLGLNSTVTMGIISAIGRGQLNLSHNRDRYSVENFIQTDAAINPGNSGGGLFNLEGSLIGINTAIATQTGTYIGYGFAIPVDLAKQVALDLIRDGKISRGYIGVEIRTIDEVEAKAVGLDKVEGVVVGKVLENSPAEKAGLEMGDVILDIDGVKVKTSNELQSKLVFRKVGDEIKLKVWRDGKELAKTVKLKARPDDKTSISAKSGDNENDEDTPKSKDEVVKFDDLGFTVEPMKKDLKETLEIESGIGIKSVERYSVAAERGLIPGGAITKVDKQVVTSCEQLKKYLSTKKVGDAIRIYVKYKDSSRIVAIEVPEKKKSKN